MTETQTNLSIGAAMAFVASMLTWASHFMWVADPVSHSGFSGQPHESPGAAVFWLVVAIGCSVGTVVLVALAVVAGRGGDK